MQLIEVTQENRNNSGIYCITNTIDDRIYIGSAKCFDRRFKEHLYNLRKDKHSNLHIQRFYNKYGEKCLLFSILEISDIYNLIEREQHYINLFSPKFNICQIAYCPASPKSRTLTETDIANIANLYNSGVSGCKIAEDLFGNRDFRSKINRIIKGESYSEYSYLFNYIKGKLNERFFSEETRKSIGNKNKNNKIGKLDKETVLKIRELSKIFSQIELSKKFNINSGTINMIVHNKIYKYYN